MTRLSNDLVHASCVAKDGHAILLSGPSGSGKSDLAFRLIDRGWTLVSDDQTLVAHKAGLLRASAPESIAGKIELRGIGIVSLDYLDDVPLLLNFRLGPPGERLPQAQDIFTLFGIDLASYALDAHAPSAAAKIDYLFTRALKAP